MHAASRLGEVAHHPRSARCAVVTPAASSPWLTGMASRGQVGNSASGMHCRSDQNAQFGPAHVCRACAHAPGHLGQGVIGDQQTPARASPRPQMLLRTRLTDRRASLQWLRGPGARRRRAAQGRPAPHSRTGFRQPARYCVRRRSLAGFESKAPARVTGAPALAADKSGNNATKTSESSGTSRLWGAVTGGGRKSHTV